MAAPMTADEEEDPSGGARDLETGITWVESPAGNAESAKSAAAPALANFVQTPTTSAESGDRLGEDAGIYAAPASPAARSPTARSPAARSPAARSPAARSARSGRSGRSARSAITALTASPASPTSGVSRARRGDVAAGSGAEGVRNRLSSFVRYDPSAFHTGDLILGAWRQTHSDFQRTRLQRPPRVRRRVVSWSTSNLSSEEPEASGEHAAATAGGPDDAAPTSSVSSSMKQRRPQRWHTSGIRNQYPALHAWLAKRFGTRESACLVVCFALLEAARFVLAEYTYVRSVNPQSMAVVADAVSLVVALGVSFILEGTKASVKIFSWRPMWRFLGVAVLFASAAALNLLALRSGTSAAQVVTVGYIYMPLSAVLSYYVFRRRYGTLEWLAMGMLTLAILAFVFLREQSKGETTSEIARIRGQYNVSGLFLIICSVAASVMGSIMAERIFKDRSKGLKWWSARFYVMKVHLDFGQFVISGLVWALPFVIVKPQFLAIYDKQWPLDRDWFGAWGAPQLLMVAVLAGQSWLAGLLVKEFSTVMRALTQSLALVLVMCVEDPILGNRYHFISRKVPSVVLTVIIFLCAVIFQTGRLNLRDIREAADLDRSSSDLGGAAVKDASTAASEPAACDDGDGGVGALEDSPRSKGHGCGTSAVSEPRQERSATDRRPGNEGTQVGEGEGSDEVVFASRSSSASSSEGSPVRDASSVRSVAERKAIVGRRRVLRALLALCATYALISVYTLSDAARNLILQHALASTRINSNSMGLAQYVCGVAFASCLTLYTNGIAGLREAANFQKVLRCTPAGLLFAVQATLMNMAYSQGVSAALALVLGRVYIPVAAVGARCVLGKFYMWLEYAAICILTLATVAFGYLKGFDVVTGTPLVGDMAPMLLVMASASVAALNSLITERLLKGETAPFHLQKIRLDLASALSSFVLLPVVGIISVRAQDVPWVKRPISRSCDNPVCWSASEGGCANAACDCECGSGVFAGWTSEAMPVILLALAIGVAYNWLVGKLVQRFSTVHRCIADSFSLLLIYFVGDPLFNHTKLDNMCLNLVALIVPFSSGLFAVAASEMQWVMEAVARLRAASESELAEPAISEEVDGCSEEGAEAGRFVVDEDAPGPLPPPATACVSRGFFKGGVRAIVLARRPRPLTASTWRSGGGTPKAVDGRYAL